MVPYGIDATLSDANGLTGVRLKNNETGETEDVELDGLFYAIGHDPNSKVFSEFVEVDEHGYIVVNDFT